MPLSYPNIFLFLVDIFAQIILKAWIEMGMISLSSIISKHCLCAPLCDPICRFWSRIVGPPRLHDAYSPCTGNRACGFWRWCPKHGRLPNSRWRGLLFWTCVSSNSFQLWKCLKIRRPWSFIAHKWIREDARCLPYNGVFLLFTRIQPIYQMQQKSQVLWCVFRIQPKRNSFFAFSLRGKHGRFAWHYHPSFAKLQHCSLRKAFQRQAFRCLTELPSGIGKEDFIAIVKRQQRNCLWGDLEPLACKCGYLGYAFGCCVLSQCLIALAENIQFLFAAWE